MEQKERRRFERRDGTPLRDPARPRRSPGSDRNGDATEHHQAGHGRRRQTFAGSVVDRLVASMRALIVRVRRSGLEMAVRGQDAYVTGEHDHREDH